MSAGRVTGILRFARSLPEETKMADLLVDSPSLNLVAIDVAR